MARKTVQKISCLACDAQYTIDVGDDLSLDITYCCCCGEGLVNLESDPWSGDDGFDQDFSDDE